MKLHQANADIFIPDGLDLESALTRITHLGIGAHQDDLEFMAFHAILSCFHASERGFGGVTCTKGEASSRTGPYAGLDDSQMQQVRREEQRTAANVGRFAAMLQLDYPSSVVKSATDTRLVEDLTAILEASQPQIVYTHNLADKHETHIGVAVATIQALRHLPKELRPQKVFGCEVWRGLDWMNDQEKVALDVSSHPNLAAALNGVFDSQIAGGKRYDLAILGRRAANATFFNSHATDSARQVCFAMDLTPLIQDDSLDMVSYIDGFITRFQNDVLQKLRTRLGQ